MLLLCSPLSCGELPFRLLCKVLVWAFVLPLALTLGMDSAAELGAGLCKYSGSMSFDLSRRSLELVPIRALFRLRLASLAITFCGAPGPGSSLIVVCCSHLCARVARSGGVQRTGDH